MKKYIAFTIGPIYKTLKDARKTKELWAGSYLFSYIMKCLIKRFTDRSFIIPYVNKNDEIFIENLEGQKGVGLFHDRFIFEAKDGDFELLGSEIDGIIKKIARKIAAHIQKDFKIVHENVKKYFQMYFCEVEFEDETEFNSINLKINSYLDSLELQKRFIRRESTNIVAGFLKNVSGSFLMEDAFGEKTKRFESIPEIAVNELDLKTNDQVKYENIFQHFDKKEEETDYDIYQHIRKEYADIEISQYHKYVVIVHADADNLGKTIERLKKNANFGEFSKELFAFAIKAHEMIKSFGGITIFAGGDDLLFFAPVINTEGRTAFELVDDIDASFNAMFKNSDPKPTMSFGVSISYYKFPLYEALEVSRNLLNDRAKNMNNKNALAFRVIKHSGQFFEGAFEKGSREYKQASFFMKKRNEKNVDSLLLTTMSHTLYAQREIVAAAAADESRLKNFFFNNFNESVHKSQENADRINSVRDLINALFRSKNYADDEERMMSAYSAMRLNQFIHSKKI